jgi:hypothetical protein
MESIFETKEQYFEFIKQWRLACNQEDAAKLTLQNFILYAMFRGRDYKKCISPSSKDDTLANAEYWTKECNPKYLDLSPFGNTITIEMIEKARAIAGGVNNG